MHSELPIRQKEGPFPKPRLSPNTKPASHKRRSRSGACATAARAVSSQVTGCCAISRKYECTHHHAITLGLRKELPISALRFNWFNQSSTAGVSPLRRQLTWLFSSL